jgi:3-hydroxybutyryl-CoA dehydrogenase
MYKIYFTGSAELKNETISLLGDKAEISDSFTADTDIIIDATAYPLETKVKSLRETDKHSRNIPCLSSSLCHSISYQSTFVENKERLIGIGIYNTYSENRFVEIAPSKITSPQILKNAEQFLRDCNINYSIVPDKPGLVFPRILAMIINEAAQVFAEKIASLQDIDTAMKLGTNYPYGPLEWADKIGVETLYEILKSLQLEFGEDRYRPHPVLREMSNLKLKFSDL